MTNALEVVVRVLISPTLCLLILIAAATCVYMFARRRLAQYQKAIEGIRDKHQLHYAPYDRLGLAILLAVEGKIHLPGKPRPMDARRVAITDVLYTRRGERRFFVARVCDASHPCSGAVVSGFERCTQISSRDADSDSRTPCQNFGLEDVEWSLPGEPELDAFERLASRSRLLDTEAIAA